MRLMLSLLLAANASWRARMTVAWTLPVIRAVRRAVSRSRRSMRRFPARGSGIDAIAGLGGEGKEAGASGCDHAVTVRSRTGAGPATLRVRRHSGPRWARSAGWPAGQAGGQGLRAAGHP